MVVSLFIPTFAAIKILNTFYMDIKKSIKRHGWTMERLAAEMTGKDGKKGISQPSISSLVNGNPTLSRLQEIASIMGISVSELVMDENDTGTRIVCPNCGKEITIKVE